MAIRSAIVHLVLGHLSGIDSAVRGMANAARSRGDTDVVVLTPDPPSSDGPVRYLPLRVWSVAPRLQRLFRYRAIAEAMRGTDYDVVLLRYPTAIDLDPLALVRDPIARRIATIHHTKEVDEILSVSHSPANRARAGLEAVQGNRLLSRMDGIVGVTDEIRGHQVSRVRGQIKSTAVSNGIDVESVAHSRFASFNGAELRVAFVASSVAPWHGWDRLLRGLQGYRGNTRIVVDAAGAMGRRAGAREVFPRAEIRFHGIVPHTQLATIFDGAHLAVSSLAMHRVGLMQGCVLKTREYTARGLPFVYAYDDPDLRADDPFCLRIPSSDDPVDLETILDYASALSNRPDVADVARTAARSRMDWSVKVDALQRFAVSLTS